MFSVYENPLQPHLLMSGLSFEEAADLIHDIEVLAKFTKTQSDGFIYMVSDDEEF